MWPAKQDGLFCTASVTNWHQILLILKLRSLYCYIRKSLFPIFDVLVQVLRRENHLAGFAEVPMKEMQVMDNVEDNIIYGSRSET